jgi:DNA-binding transcriptional LysR family regulator
MTAKPIGKLHISAPLSIGQFMLMPVLDKLANSYPELLFEVDLSDRQIHLVEEGYDLTIRMAPSFEDSSLISRKLGEQYLVTCASNEYLSRNGCPKTPWDLKHHRCIGFRFSGTNRPAPWRFINKKSVYTENIESQFIVNNNAAMRELVLNGAGVAQLPSYVINSDLKSRRLKEILAEWRAPALDVVALWPQKRHTSPKLRVLIDCLVKEFERSL